MNALERHRVTVSGKDDAPTLLFIPGYGQFQRMWRHVVPAFENDHRVVRYDVVGTDHTVGGAGHDRFETLGDYAHDLREVCDALGLAEATLVGHSIGGMIAVLAHLAEPGRFHRLVLIGSSACYLDDDGYRGGYRRQDIEELLDAIDGNYLGWSASAAPAVMGHPERPELADELRRSFARVDPSVAARFARETYLVDLRGVMALVEAPTLVLHVIADGVVPMEAAWWLHQHIPGSRFEALQATGHFPHLSSPGPTVAALRRFLSEGPASVPA